MERRVFLGTLAAGTASLGRRGAAQGTKERIRLGVIGCGWYGGVVLDAAFKAGGVEVVALCDVDREHAAKTAQKVATAQGATPRVFADWREMLDVPRLQAVVIATPPHWHALPFIEACRRGLDVYCEKPLAYDVREGRAMVEAAKASGRVAQIGFQRRQSEAVRQARQYIADGHAGKIVSAAAQIHYPAELQDPTPIDPPPGLDWDTWCGPAPKLPYSKQVGHFHWRLEEAYGNGHLVDWGIHWIDAIRTVLGLGMPRFVQAAGGLYALQGRITTPDLLNAHFEFDGCPVTWSHRIFGAAEYSPEASISMLFYGEKETVFLTDALYEVIPAAKGAERRKVEAKSDQQTAHVGEWLNAVRTRGQVSCPPEDAYRSTAAVQLAMVALKAGGRLDWDASTEQVVANPKAAALLKREYRGPWVHPWRG
jgi:predicted dehydrogenase